MPDANDLSQEKWQAVIAALRDKINTDKFPFSDRIRVLSLILAKLDPQSAPKPRKLPPPPLPSGPTLTSGQRASRATLDGMVGSRRKLRR
jgi:hypothetical protein